VNALTAISYMLGGPLMFVLALLYAEQGVYWAAAINLMLVAWLVATVKVAFDAYDERRKRQGTHYWWLPRDD
jgi:hypothetical protein